MKTVRWTGARMAVSTEPRTTSHLPYLFHVTELQIRPSFTLEQLLSRHSCMQSTIVNVLRVSHFVLAARQHLSRFFYQQPSSGDAAIVYKPGPVHEKQEKEDRRRIADVWLRFPRLKKLSASSQARRQDHKGERLLGRRSYYRPGIMANTPGMMSFAMPVEHVCQEPL